MNWRTMAFDWNQARAFLVTAEEGSFSAAARALGLTQPTVGRQVAALETELGVTLLERVGRSPSLTQSGLELLEHFKAMGEAANRVSLTASGQSQTIEGQVCITASDAFSAYLLPPAIRHIRDMAPRVKIEVIASNSLQDLRRREADIAIRHAPPEHTDLIACLLREIPAHFYASTAYLRRHSYPATIGKLENATLIGIEPLDHFLALLNAQGLKLDKGHFSLTSESGVAAWEMVKQGLGISIMIKDIAELTSDIERLFPDLDPVPVPLWLVTHRELHTSRRIRMVYDLLADYFSSNKSENLKTCWSDKA